MTLTSKRSAVRVRLTPPSRNIDTTRLMSPVVFFVLLKDSLNTVKCCYYVATLLFTLATKLASTSVEGF
jgi:hypothetical protein